MTGDEEPVVTAHASVASTSAPGVPVEPFTDCPVFAIPHCTPKDGSFGRKDAEANAVEALTVTSKIAAATTDDRLTSCGRTGTGTTSVPVCVSAPHRG